MNLLDYLTVQGLTVEAALLDEALTHSSFVNEHPSEGPSNERMEFLGDAVLNLAVTDYLFSRYPDVDEGRLSAMRARVVRAESLTRAARSLQLGDLLRMGRGEVESGGPCKQSVLANAYEAVVAAVYRSRGLEGASHFVLDTLKPQLLAAGADPGKLDAKSALDHWCRTRMHSVPEYSIIERVGPDHAPTFKIEVCVNGERLGVGVANSKQGAEARAAREALKRLGGDDAWLEEG